MRDVNPEQFGDVIELFPDAALLLNAAGDILVANAVIHDLLGLHPEQAPGRNLAELTITPPPALEQYLRTCARSRQRIVGGFTLRHSNGHEVVCRAEGQVARPR
jgi:PAS domain S-box-containing protein